MDNQPQPTNSGIPNTQPAPAPNIVITPTATVNTDQFGQQNSTSNTTQPSDHHRVRNGVLWIVSPFIVLVGVALLQVLFHSAHITSSVINIIAFLGGIVGIILIPVGPIIGIRKLSRH